MDDPELWSFAFVMHGLMDVYFWIDMYCSFVTSYHGDDKYLVVSNKAIALNYLKTWFLLDFVSCLPFSYLTYLQDDAAVVDGSGAGDAVGAEDDFGAMKNAKTMKLLRLVRLLKLLRLARLRRIVGVIWGVGRLLGSLSPTRCTPPRTSTSTTSTRTRGRR